jgi:hypothetical protein
MAIIPLELCLSSTPPAPVPEGRYQPQHDNVLVKFPLHPITSYNVSSPTGHFVLNIGALWRCVVSLTLGSFALSPLEERSHWDQLNKTPTEQVSNFSWLRAHCQPLKRCALFKQDRQCARKEHCDAFVSPLLQWKRNKWYTFEMCVCILRYPACNVIKPYFHLWPVRLYHTVPRCLIKTRFFEKKCYWK